MNAEQHIATAEMWLEKAKRDIGYGQEIGAVADAHINLARLKIQMPPAVQGVSPTGAPGIADPDAVTGWAPGHSPRSVYGDEH